MALNPQASAPPQGRYARPILKSAWRDWYYQRVTQHLTAELSE